MPRSAWAQESLRPLRPWKGHRGDRRSPFDRPPRRAPDTRASGPTASVRPLEDCEQPPQLATVGASGQPDGAFADHELERAPSGQRRPAVPESPAPPDAAAQAPRLDPHAAAGSETCAPPEAEDRRSTAPLRPWFTKRSRSTSPLRPWFTTRSRCCGHSAALLRNCEHRRILAREMLLAAVIASPGRPSTSMSVERLAR